MNTFRFHSTLALMARKVLAFIIDFQSTRGYSPSLREIQAGVGLKSIRGVSLQLEKLESQGYIRRQKQARRAITVLADAPSNSQTITLPLVGEIQAGAMTLAEQNIEEYRQVSRDKVRGWQNAFLLRVRGESMSRAGYHTDDIVIIAPNHTPDNRDIVVAREGDDATLKRFERRGDHAVLWPESNDPQYHPIIARDVSIDGIVIGKLT